MISSGKANDLLKNINKNGGAGCLEGSVKLLVKDAEGNDVGAHTIANWSGGDDGEVDNQTLDTAKIIFSKLAAGLTDFKIAKIMFGNAGHDFTNSKFAVEATSSDVELNAISHIRTSLSAASTEHFTYTDTGSNVHRMAVLEKDIDSSHITFGENGNQFIVSVPVSFDEFNFREGADHDNTEALFSDDTTAYDFLDAANSIVSVRNIDAAGAIVSNPTKPLDDTGTLAGTHTEVDYNTDGANPLYRFKNGVDLDGNVVVGGTGARPQEISEILLSASITEEDGIRNKYASSRMTSGLLVFPSGFTFTYQWSLTWTFA